MLIEKAIYDLFKGIGHLEIDLRQGVNMLCGKNGTFKSTTYAGYTWLFADKTPDLLSNPEVRNTNGVPGDPSVTIIADENGRKIKFRKFQVDVRTRKQKEEGAPLRISNRYEINDVPKTQKDFYADIESMGIKIDLFQLLINADYLLDKKMDDKRKEVFVLAGDVSDIDVAKMLANCPDATRELEAGYTCEEVAARYKSIRKRCEEKKKSIPNEMIGMEKSKVEIDPSLQQKIDELRAEIAELSAKKAEAVKKGDASKIDLQVRELANRKVELYNQANAERLDKYRIAHEEVDKADDAVSDAKRDLFRIETDGNGLNSTYSKFAVTYKNLSERLKALKAERFSGATKCPTCGQMIPKTQIDSAKIKWGEQHDQAVTDIEAQMRATKTQMDSYKAEGKELAKKKADAVNNLETAKANLKKAQEVITQYTEPVVPDYSEIETKIAELNAAKERCQEEIKTAYVIGDEIATKNAQLQELVRKQAAEVNNAHIDERIEEAKSDLRTYIQGSADAENMLYQLSLISQKKNEMLSEQVNSHFTKVKFRLFQTLKNGEIKDDCTPLVKCADGEYREITSSANTAAVVAAKLDICQGFQKFYGVNLPIWIDGAECLDEKNRSELETDNQLILLCVTEDERLVVK